MPKVTRDDIPNYFQQQTGFTVSVSELKQAAELDRIACADAPRKLMRELWGIGPKELARILGAPSRTVEQWYYKDAARPASWVVRLIVEKCASIRKKSQKNNAS